jgi:hypothetical protein
MLFFHNTLERDRQDKMNDIEEFLSQGKTVFRGGRGGG